MKTIKLFLMCILVLTSQITHAAAPFLSTAYIDPDIITASDLTTFTNLTYVGQGTRTMYDNRINDYTNYNAFLFNASFSDGLALEVDVNPEFGTTNAAASEVNKYATVVGRLPTVLRSQVLRFWIHKGEEPFGAANYSLLIHTGKTNYEAGGFLEEVFATLAGYVSLNATHAGAAGWLAAQANDPDFISTNAQNNSTTQDVGESFVAWLAVRYRSARITAAVSNTIVSTIPNRLAYFNQQNFNLFPFVQEIAVFAGAAQIFDNSGTNVFPNTDVGSTSGAYTFTIKNIGGATLTGLALSKGGLNPGDFTLGSLGVTTLAPGAATTFTVAFAPTAGGVRRAFVNIASNDTDENPFSINVSGTGNPPEIAVFTGFNTDAANARTSNAGTNVFADTYVGTSTNTQTFTIKNVGTANLSGLALTKVGANPGDFILGSLGSTTLAPQDITTFNVTFAPTAGLDRRAVVDIASNVADENPFRINVSGKGVTAPEIAVFTGANTNAASERTDNVGTNVFANTWVGASSATQTFTIKNVGSGYLTGLALTIAGANPGDFDLGGLGYTTLLPGSTTTFTVTFAPAATGGRSAVVNIASDDADENPFSINVSGTAIGITQQPANTGACVGSPATFQVVAAGSSLTYQWQRRAPGSATFANIASAMNSNYTTPSVVAGDDGAGFRVIVSQGATSAFSSEAVLSVVSITSVTATYNFTSGNLGGGSIYGDASVVSNALMLTPAAQGKNGAFVLPALAPGERVQGFTAQFKLQIAQGNGYADGFSFNWATDLPSGVFTNAEEGAGSALRVCFDTFRNVDEPALSIDAKWGTNVIASYQTSNSFLPGTNDFANVAIRLHSDGTLDVTYRCVPIFSRLPIPGYTPLVGGRFGLGARTGGFYETHTIDDLAIEIDTLVAVVEASVPDDVAVGTSANSPAAQTAPKAIDNIVTSKYLNLDKLNTGLTITPTGQKPVRALTLISAEDAPERDPSSFVLEGSNNGTNFTRIASNAVPVFPARNFIQSFAVANTNVFNQYRLLFPTVANAAAANSMQIAEVELLYNAEITSTNDALSITLPPGAVDVRGVGMLFDRQLGLLRKFEIAPIAGGNTVVQIIPAAGPTVLRGFELIGAADDFTFPQRRPSSVAVAGSADGINYTNLTTIVPAAPSFNLQIQEFATSSNTTAFTHYRITFGPPVSGDRLQVGEMRLFGELSAGAPPSLTIHPDSGNVLVSWPNSPGYLLESKAALTDATWTSVGTAPVLSNGVNTVTLPASGSAAFFRLRK